MAAVGAPETLAKMKTIVAFRYFTEESLRDILSRSEVVPYRHGDLIIVEGEKSPYFYAVLDGTVNVTVKDGDKEVFICAIGQGEVFGEAGIFLNMKRTANVVCTDAVEVLRVRREQLLAFIKERPSEGIKFLMIIIYSLLKKLRDANQELAFERKSDVQQEDIDSMVDAIMNEK